jgi:hypothetical protein
LTEDGDKSTTLHPGHFMSWGTSPEYQWRGLVNFSSSACFNHENYLILWGIKPQFMNHPAHTQSLYWVKYPACYPLVAVGLRSFIPRHQRLINRVSIFNLKITITILNHIQYDGQLQSRSAQTGPRWHSNWYNELNWTFMKDSSLPFWLLKFSNSSTAITFANTSNRCFLDLPGDSLWYGHCVCHVMLAH